MLFLSKRLVSHSVRSRLKAHSRFFFDQDMAQCRVLWPRNRLHALSRVHWENIVPTTGTTDILTTSSYAFHVLLRYYLYINPAVLGASRRGTLGSRWWEAMVPRAFVFPSPLPNAHHAPQQKELGNSEPVVTQAASCLCNIPAILRG